MRRAVLIAMVFAVSGCVAGRPAPGASTSSGALSQYEHEYLRAHPLPAREVTRPDQASQSRGRDVQATGAGQTGGSVLGNYLTLVDWKIQQQWVPFASSAGTERVVVVHFRVLRSGQVMNVQIEKSSGDTALDSSALQAMTRGAPLPPFPEHLTVPFLDLRYQFTMER